MGKSNMHSKVVRICLSSQVLSSHCFVPVVEEAALFVNGWSDYLWIKDASMCWISGKPCGCPGLVWGCPPGHHQNVLERKPGVVRQECSSRKCVAPTPSGG